MPSLTNRKGQTYYLRESVRKDGRPHYFCTMKNAGGTLAATIPDGCEFHEKPESAQVFLRKKFSSKITKQELLMLRGVLAHHCDLPEWATVIDRTRDALVVYSSDRAEDFLRSSSRETGLRDDDDSKIIQMPFQGQRQQPSLPEAESVFGARAHDLKQLLMGFGRSGFGENSEAFISDINRGAAMSPVFKFTPVAVGKPSAKTAARRKKTKKGRLFSVDRYHFSWERWAHLSEGTLMDLAARLVPHIGKESYFELSR